MAEKQKTKEEAGAQTPQPVKILAPKRSEEGGGSTTKPQLARPSHMKQRHWGLLLSFVLLVVVPLSALTVYLWTQAEDQYSSTTGFAVRSDEGGAASDFLGGLAQFTRTGVGGDSDILYEFIQSQDIVHAIDTRLDLRSHYSQYWPKDWMFSIWPTATLEDLVWFWQRIVRISYDQSTGLIEVRVLAFDQIMAQRISEEIVTEGNQNRINALNNQARADAMRYAQADLDAAVEQLKQARANLTSFRTRTRIVDPAKDLESRMGVMSNLQQQLAEALIEYDLLRGETFANTDPRLQNARRRIEVTRERIAAERKAFVSDETDLEAIGEDYPTLIAEFESLSVDREFAQQTYIAALTALDAARANIARQSRYLAIFIKPILAESSEFPRRFTLIGLAAFFCVVIWSILALIYYSIRDRG